MAAAGWRPGAAFPTGSALAAASGAAFITVVLAQTANAFACRSSTVSPWRLGWTGNRLLIGAASIELAFSMVVLFWVPVAAELGHAPPPLVGWVVGFGSMAVLLGVDAAYKRRRRRPPGDR
jgi:magnesium-transporting ATPase (P-type)